jgi:AraC family L-rhamnose operon regulatory protein RhaS
MFGDARHRSAEQRLEPHYNPGIEVCLCRSGVYRWDVEGREVELRPGDLSVTRPWQRHSARDSVLGPGRLCWIILAAEGEGVLRAPLLKKMLGQDADAVLAVLSADSRAYLGQLPDAAAIFYAIRTELASDALGRVSAVRAEVCRLLTRVSRRLARTEPPGEEREAVPERVLAVLKEVAQTPDRQWTSGEMAVEAGLGLTAFTEWCRRVTGRSPRWYVLEQRLDRGRELLASTPRPVTEIALEIGFSSSQHFSSAFRKLYGESPTEYRRRAR